MSNKHATMRCAIIGAGLAGLSCADELSAAGNSVVLFDKGRGPGGRMSTRRINSRFGEVRIDHGAPCLHAADPTFRKTVEAWQAMRVVELWPPGGPDAWIGMPGMSAVLGHMSQRHQVFWNTFVRGVVCDVGGSWHILSEQDVHGPFDAAIMAVPAEQATPILSLYDLNMARVAAMAVSRSCWSGLFVFEHALQVPPGLRRSAGILELAVCNRSKLGRNGPEAWVVHANAQWSKEHIEKPAAEVAPMLLTALKGELGLQLLPPVELAAHRWRYASAVGVGHDALWNPGIRLGACADWLLGPRAECAWISGHRLARTINGSVASGVAA